LENKIKKTSSHCVDYKKYIEFECFCYYLLRVPVVQDRNCFSLIEGYRLIYTQKAHQRERGKGLKG